MKVNVAVKAFLAESPKIFFLMLTYGGIGNREMWKLFLQSINEDKYAFFVHAKIHIVAPFDGFKFTRVKTVYNEYCDLVEPMKELLSVAVKASKHKNDHFIFISSDTLPMKPFHVIYEHFTTYNKASNICITPSEQWYSLGGDWLLPKTHQWMTLNRNDALKFVAFDSSNTYSLLQETFDKFREENSGGRRGYSFTD